jgi:hypothetical protein
LVGQYQAASAGAALSYLGKDAIISADETYLAGGSANWAYRLPEAATEMTVSVKDMQGRTRLHVDDRSTRRRRASVYVGRHVKNDGSTATDGVYQIVIDAKNAAWHVADTNHQRSRNYHGRRLHWSLARCHHAFGHTRFDTIRSVLENG